MTTLEKIRAEIAQLQDEWFKETDGWWCYEKALQIIDKYAEQEPQESIEQIRAEIEDLHSKSLYAYWTYDDLVELLDKYTKGEN